MKTHNTQRDLHRIADALELLSYSMSLSVFCLDDMERDLDEIAKKRLEPYVQKGLSAICQNAYLANHRIDEVKDLLDMAFKKKGLKEKVKDFIGSEGRGIEDENTARDSG